MQQMIVGIVQLCLQLAGLCGMAAGLLHACPEDCISNWRWKKEDMFISIVGLIVFIEASIVLIIH